MSEREDVAELESVLFLAYGKRPQSRGYDALDRLRDQNQAMREALERIAAEAHERASRMLDTVTEDARQTRNRAAGDLIDVRTIAENTLASLSPPSTNEGSEG